jgi:2-polyprenyl-6-methoxyphenol hydroxylase-like FAD-dependent oxidoreductase
MTHPVSVIGGGIAGTVLAKALSQRGIDYRVFERNGGSRFRGGALLLWSNALQALREIDLDHLPRGIGQELECLDFCTAEGRVLWTLRADRWARRGGAPCVLVPRAELLEGLDRQVPADKLVRADFERFDLEPDAVSARFSDGSVARSRLLIGADGLRSMVRRQLEGRAAPARFTGQTIWVGTTLLSHPRLPAGRAFASMGRGVRFWAAALPGGRIFWYALLRQRAAPTSLPDLARHFRGFLAPVQDVIVNATHVADTVIADARPSKNWGQGPVTLIGDAIHSVTPDLGQGACQAIESAVTLAESLATRGVGTDALRHYENSRRSRTRRISNLSYVTAVNSMVSDPLACKLRDFGIAKLLPFVAAPELAFITRGRKAC